jgi:cytidyltransferase-like protein
MYSQRVKTVFISGNFSVLHPGHIRLFHLAKRLGQKLVVGINSDLSVVSSMKVPLDLRIESLKSIQMQSQGREISISMLGADHEITDF